MRCVPDAVDEGLGIGEPPHVRSKRLLNGLDDDGLDRCVQAHSASPRERVATTACHSLWPAKRTGECTVKPAK